MHVYAPMCAAMLVDQLLFASNFEWSVVQKFVVAVDALAVPI